jgi:ABC-2 type transport system permease protein
MTAARVGSLWAVGMRLRAIARRHAYVALRSPHRLFDLTVWPVVDAVLFGSLAIFFQQAGGGSAARTGAGYLLAGVVLWHVVYQSQIAVATGVLEETWSRNLLSLLVTPIREIEFVAGVALFGLAKVAIGVGVVAAVAAGLYAFDITGLGLGLIPVIAVLLAAGWAIALFVVGLVLRFGTGAEVLAWGILFMILPLSGVFYPLEALPAAVRPLASLLPTTYAFRAGRALVEGRPMPWGQLGIAAATTAIAIVAALGFAGWMLHVFRRRGYITRYM